MSHHWHIHRPWDAEQIIMVFALIMVCLLAMFLGVVFLGSPLPR